MANSNSYTELKPLIQHCKTGHLFEVQDWINDGKPVNLPPHKKGTRRKSPLEVAIDCRFYSMVQILLEAGAEYNHPYYGPIDSALSKRRLNTWILHQLALEK